MLHSFKALSKFSLKARDGEIGSVSDFYFDDRVWNVRYLIADTGGWLASRLVMIAPDSLGLAAWEKENLSVELTREQIENSPSIERKLPVSRQKELELIEYYHWNDYWAMHDITIPPSGLIISGVMHDDKAKKEIAKSDNKPWLRSMDELNGYIVHATDGETGHIADFFIDDKSWRIRFIVVDTSNIPLMGKKVLVPPEWIESVEWNKRSIFLNISRELVEKSPEYDSQKPFEQKSEEKNYDYYQRPKNYV